MKQIALIATLVACSITPAHAISEAYRHQLERSHTTQMQDAHRPAAAAHVQPFTKRLGSTVIVRHSDGIVTVNGKPAALDETEPDCLVYSSGLMTIMVYKNGKVAVMEQGQFKGYAK